MYKVLHSLKSSRELFHKDMTVGSLPMKSLIVFLAVIGSAGLETGAIFAQHKILFLHLRMKDDTIHLVGSTLRAGFLKEARESETASGLEYEVRSSAGGLLFKEGIDDPSIERFEYEDPANPGILTVKQVMLKDVDFTVRVPFTEGMRDVEFYRPVSTEWPSFHKDGRRCIGRIEVHQERGPL